MSSARTSAVPRLRVVHVIDHLAGGGAAQLEVTFARELTHRPVDLTVVSLYHPEPGWPPPWDDALRAAGVDVHQLDVPDAGLQRRVRPVAELARLVIRLRPHVLRTALTSGNTMGAIVGRFTRTPVVATLHATYDETQRHSARTRGLETAALRWGATRVVAVGQSVADSHRDRLGREVLVVPNAVALPVPVPASERARLRRELTGDVDRPLVLTVGRLVSQKGLPDLLAAFGKVLSAHPDAVLVLAGAGPLRQELETRVAQIGLGPAVRVLGDRQDVPQLLAAADVFASASLWEGLPLALLEAMASGLPVVATAVGENERLLSGGRGLLVPPGVPDLLGTELVRLLDDRQLAAGISAAASAYVSAVHSPRVWVDRLLEVYRDAAGLAPDVALAGRAPGSTAS